MEQEKIQMDNTFLLAIATFILAFVATMSAGFTAWMAWETKTSNALTKKLVKHVRDIAVST
jgi:hypothetical protein